MSRASVAPAADAEVPAARIAPPALRCAARSHPGLVRDLNEDRVLIDPARGAFAVIDGIGGEAAGEQAAETALQRIRQRLERANGGAEERLREAITVANNGIVEAARTHRDWEGMGCVVTAAIVEGDQLTVGHVGDSRLYVLRDGGMEKITRDHSPVGEREDRGELGEREAMRHPRRNEVYRSLGAEEHAPLDPEFVEITHRRFAQDEALLLCSDGLTDVVGRDEILERVRRHAPDVRGVVDALIDAALAGGGKDNVSVVFVAGSRFAGGSGAAVREPSPVLERVRRALANPWVALALGAVAGALAMWALMRDGAPEPATPASTPPVVAAQVLEVGPGQRFRTIGDALGAAHPGDIVRVSAGVYREQLRLREGVAVISAPPRAAVLAPTGDGTGPVVGVVAERVGAARLSGFSIRGGTAAPLDVGIRLSGAEVVIEDVAVSGARLAGIVIEPGGAPAVIASRIHDNSGAGVLVRSGASARIAHDLIENNGQKPGALAPGIELERGARADIESNVIVGNGAAGVRGVGGAQRKAVLERNVFQAGVRANPVAVAPAERGAAR